jgi:hypothetical protein
MKLLGMMAAGMAMFASQQAQAVAGFARQFNMSCNQCHTLHGAPTPNFTFTGKKFKAMGYRLPGGTPQTVEPSLKAGEPKDLGEYISLLATTASGRFQYSLANTSKPAGSDEWGDVVTNPTSRLAFFPFTGPIGNHFGIWTEWYVVPLNSEDSEWGIADSSYEEFDFRYIFNPGDRKNTFGAALTNQGARELFGWGPYPGLGSGIGRGGIGGYTHPNRAQLYVYGWMNDRWVWALGGDTGDTNHNWHRSNGVGLFGFLLANRNDNEIWLDTIVRIGPDVLPLVSANAIQGNNFAYRDSIGGVSDTRRPPGDPCPGSPGRRVGTSCAYLADEVEDAQSVDFEFRWSGQDVSKIFKSGSPGNISYDFVARVGFSSEEYDDTAETENSTWGLSVLLGWKHTYFVKSAINGYINYEFTDLAGVNYDVDSDPTYNLSLVYKPVENFLIYLDWARNQNLSLNANPTKGQSISVTADISF